MVGIYLFADSMVTTTDTLLGYSSLSSLAAGAQQSLNTTLTIPVGIIPRTYYVGAIADYNNSVKESDETNNSLAGNQIAIKKP